MWLGTVAFLGAFVIFTFANLGVFIARARHIELDVELLGSFTTGFLAVIAAFYLSLPDRSPRWALLPLPSLALWLSGSGASCYHQWLINRNGTWKLGESSHCLLFILGIGLPLGAALMLGLRKAHPIAPLRVAVIGGLGVAALATFLLQFFHPFDVTMMDLTIHTIAVAIVVSIIAWRRSWALG
jgi:hypothetical protein